MLGVELEYAKDGINASYVEADIHHQINEAEQTGLNIREDVSQNTD